MTSPTNEYEPAIKFSSLTRAELLEYCRKLHQVKGVEALAYPSLKRIKGLYSQLYEKGLSQKVLLKELGLADEYKQFTLSQPRKYGETFQVRWSWELVVSRTKEIMLREGRLPPALWFQKSGEGSLVQFLYSSGHTWDELRAAVGDFSNSNFVESRNGLRWLSHAEASFSNFLYARGVEHKKGERYDDSFKRMGASRYAIFDCHFKDKHGKWVDVEIWGDRPNGHGEQRYANVRLAKEVFNHDNPRFLGIHHGECYEESVLAAALEPHIGRIAPFKFDKATDVLIHSTHWSNADELLDFCKELASKIPGGKFPSEDWLRKRGRWACREGAAYNTLSVYIKQWLGGTRKLRELLGQSENSTDQWDDASATAAYKAFFDKHGKTPGQVRSYFRRFADSRFSEDVSKEAARIDSAVGKYAGGAASVKRNLGIKLGVTRGPYKKRL
jgi:hypothetical protein